MGGVAVPLTASELVARIVTVGCAYIAVKILSAHRRVDSWSKIAVQHEMDDAGPIVWTSDVARVP
eukprot:11219823-Lingulodinium_polyedra.AAC.1